MILMRNRLAVLTLVAANALGVAVAPTAAWINKPAAATPTLTTIPAGGRLMKAAHKFPAPTVSLDLTTTALLEILLGIRSARNVREHHHAVELGIRVRGI